MLSFYCKIKALWATRDRGASGVEYALLLAAIVAIVAGLVFTIGQVVQGQFESSCAAVKKSEC